MNDTMRVLDNAKDILRSPERLILEEVVAKIPGGWSEILGLTITEEQAVQMLIYYRVVQLGLNPDNEEAWVQMAALCAVGGRAAADRIVKHERRNP